MKRLVALVFASSCGPALAGAGAAVPNPEVPCWMGEGADKDGFVGWDTRESERPFLITHDRDQFRSNGQLEEDYNYINYWFGHPASPIVARHYLASDEVSVILPDTADRDLDLASAKAAIPSGVLCYLQTRFAKVVVLTSKGYETIWTTGTSDD